MDRKAAGRLSNEAAKFYAAHEDYGNRPAQLIAEALTRQLAEFVPDNATGTVIEHEDGLPLVVAVDEQNLYAVNVIEADDQSPPVTRCRLVPVDREHARIEAEVRYRGSEATGITRSVTWRLRFGDLSLTLPSGTDTDARERRDAFARRAAAALGWTLPDHPPP